MLNVVRWILAFTAALVILGPPLLLYRHQYIHAKRFREVEPGRLYRSGQMTASGLREIVRLYKIRTVINLQHEAPDPFLPDRWLGRGKIHESELCRELGVKYILIKPDLLPKNNRLDVLPPSIDEYLKVMDDPANYPVLLHCKAGLHRTGRLTAIFRMEYQGWSEGEALRELRANGYGYTASSEADEFVIQFVQNYVPRAQRPKALPVAPRPRAIQAADPEKTEGGGS